MTSQIPTRRQVNQHPSPDFAEAVNITRFWRSVEVTDPNNCWPWLGDTSGGYGIFRYHGRVYGAHELALTFTTGEERAPEFDTCHSCDNRPCCNPAHLRFDTRASNVADMVAHGRQTRPNLRLTDETVREIRERRAHGARQKDLAEQYGVSDGWICMLVTGQRRLDAGGPISPLSTRARKAA